MFVFINAKQPPRFSIPKNLLNHIAGAAAQEFYGYYQVKERTWYPIQ
jgi:hypothetical protein